MGAGVPVVLPPKHTHSQSPDTLFLSRTHRESSMAPSPPLSKQNPNPSPNSSPTPITPSPLQTNCKKPVMVTGSGSSPPPSSPVPSKGSCAEELVGKRLRVYWPLDRTWYKGYVVSFDQVSGKHLVRYDDSEEELLNLSEEKIEWINEQVKKFRRLKKDSMVDDDEETKLPEDEMESGLDDSGDEDLEEEEDDISGKSGAGKKVELSA